VTRYKDDIRYWEIWNEPNTTWFWGTPNAKEYAALVAQSSKLIREIDADCKIIGGSLARVDVPYAKELFELGIANHIDVFSFHPYGVFPEASRKKMKVQVKMPLVYEPVMNTVDGLQQLIDESGRDIELWQGECGYPSAINGSGWNGTGPYSKNIQAKWILRRGFTDLGLGLNVSAYFMIKENKNPYREYYNFKGLLEFHELRPKVGYDVYRNLNAIVNGAYYLDTLTTCEFEIINEGGLPGLKTKNIASTILRKGDQIWIAYWGVTHMQNSVNEGQVDLKISKINEAKSYDLVDFFSGNIYEINDVLDEGSSVQLKGLPLSDYPYLVRVK
ncbi:MAG: hypothetical protein HRT61_04325, partial [Ekhidna sp.]|nr:hypothetical protein [Ekhidna sp.]